MKKLIITLCLFFSPFALSEMERQENEIVDSISGVNYEIDSAGNFARLRSSSEIDLDIGDRKDIRLAIQKAQIKAKANIAKFLNERITTDEIIEQIENKITETNGKNKQVNRKTIENYTEKIQNSAETILKGVIVTKTDINKDEKYVFVEVGYSPKTQQIADGISNNLESDLSHGSGSENIEEGKGREIKKIKNYDSF